MEYRRAKESEWKVFDQYALNLPSRKVEVPAEETGLEPGGVYLFRAWQKGVDQKPRESSAGPLTVPGAEIDPADQAALESAPFDSSQPVSDNQTVEENARSIFDGQNWPKIMFWYNLLASLSGVFILWSIIKCGYKYILHPFNPGVRASLMETVQRCIVAVAIIALAPAFVKVLVAVNDAFVSLLAQAGNQLINNPGSLQTGVIDGPGVFEKILAVPFQIVLNLLDLIFGLYDLDDLIFNGHLTAFGDGFFSGRGIDVGNVFGNVLVQLAFVGFTVYFNVLYTLRHWVIVATLAATPLLVWIWVLSEEKQVIEIWAGELVSTTFMQLFHALNFAVLFSIASAVPLSNLTDTSLLARGLKDLGLWVARFGGAAAVLAIVFMGLKLILARDEKARAEAQEGIGKALLGVIILGLSLAVAGFLAHLLSGDWGAREGFLPAAKGQGMRTWDVLFMLMVIIPVSKMMHNVFMKLIQRIGTVDEEKWAAAGATGLAGLAGLVVMGKTAAGAVFGRTASKLPFRAQGPNTLVSGDAPTRIGGGLGPIPGSMDFGRTKHNLADTVERKMDIDDPGQPVNLQSAQFAGTRPEGSGFSGGGFDEVIERGIEGSNAWAKFGAGFGAASSFAVPQLIPMMGGIGAAFGKVVGSPFATARAIGSGIMSRTTFGMTWQRVKGTKDDHGFFRTLEVSGGLRGLASDMKTAAREMTGAKSTAGAVVRMGAAVTLSPMGSRVASWGARQAGTIYDAASGFSSKWRG
ncbi:MAG: pilin [Peptococcaceae bacterium]|nr:pilin [Peptococcaceae bacterium]